MIESRSSFGELFKKYRLKSELAKLSDLGNALAEKGFIYEDSIFSHWQKGTRVPQNRGILIKLVEIFSEKGAIKTINQANEFLASAGQGYFSEDEIYKISAKFENPAFQVPSQITNFSGRKEIINKIINRNNLNGKVILLHGPAGVGKTALAIKLGHLLKNKFKDGVLWYKVEEDNAMDILLSIAKFFGEDLSNISDAKVRGSVVRSLLSEKNVLLFLDSAELYDNIDLLIPNSQVCTTIITSQKSQLKIPIQYTNIKVTTFTNEEVLILFKDVLKEKYSKNGKNKFLKIAKKVGNLPLAVHILARELLHGNLQITQMSTLLNHESSLFQDLFYEDKNLNAAISISYKKLDSITKATLVSASIFQGKDFSLDSIAYINGLPKHSALRILHKLVDLSLIEISTKNRFRIHPAIKDFARNKLNYPRSSMLLIIATLMYLFFLIWWIFPQFPIQNKEDFRLGFAGSYFIMALYGGILGVHASFSWGGLKTLLGKAIFLFSLGLFMQVIGQLVYAYYNRILNIQVPYPSLGDIGYFGTIPFYLYGVFLLAKSSGIQVNFQSFRKKIIALIIPIIMLTLGYWAFLRNYNFDFNNPLKVFLDFGYPLGEAIYISIAIITFIFSRRVLDGIMKSKALLILIALLVQYLADYTFLFTSATFYPGNYVDLIYLTAYFVMTLAFLSLKSISIKVFND
jgi:hypothetical protein